MKKTSDIQVIAKKEGWGTSFPAKKTVVRAKYQITSVKLNKQPNDRYKAEGGSSLANFKKGTINFTEGEWLGFEGTHMTATLDMGKILKITNVSVSALEATNSYIFFPKQLNVAVSADGKNFKNVAKKTIPTTLTPEPSFVKNFTLPLETQNARYIKIEVKSNLVNPSWHPAPGAPCWVFIDEIMVE